MMDLVKFEGWDLDTTDADPRVTWRYAQRRGSAGEWAVEVQIESRAS